MELSTAAKTSLARKILSLPAPEGFWAQVEKLACMAQGKGAWMMTLDTEVEACLSLLGQTPAIVCDVGANRGLYTDTVMKYAPNARYFLFEPAAANITTLQQKYLGNPDVTIIPVALSSKSGEATLHAEAAGAETASMSLANEWQDRSINDHRETIKTERLDSLWPELISANQIIVD